MSKSKSTQAPGTKTVAYDVAEQLRMPEEMTAYLDAWLVEAPDDAPGIARALRDIARAKGTMALQELIALREQRRVADLLGKLEWDKSFDCKAERSQTVKTIAKVKTAFPFEAYRHIVSPIDAVDGGGFMFTMPDIPGVVVDGATELEAIADGREAFIATVRAMVEMGQDVPAPDSQC